MGKMVGGILATKRAAAWLSPRNSRVSTVILAKCFFVASEIITRAMGQPLKFTLALRKLPRLYTQYGKRSDEPCLRQTSTSYTNNFKMVGK